MSITNELETKLKSYIAGIVGISDLSEWLASIDWTSERQLPDADREMLGTVEVLVTEIIEGLRPESELDAEARYWLIGRGAFPSGASVTSSSQNGSLTSTFTEQIALYLPNTQEQSVQWDPQLSLLAETPRGRSSSESKLLQQVLS